MIDLGDEQADELRRACDQIVEREVVSGGGAIVKYLGDGAVATFESASAAINAAVHLLRSIDTRNRRVEGSFKVSLRVGISAGDVTWEDGDIFGTPVVEAARLEAATATDSILCSDVVRILAGSRTSVELEPAGALELKGLPAPLVTWTIPWQPLQSTAPPLPPRIGLSEANEFVGRADQMQSLMEAKVETDDQRLGVVMIAGEPGAGKSRLAREFARSAHAAGAAVLIGRCDDGVSRPHAPFIQALQLALGWDSPFADMLGGMRQELQRLVPSESGAQEIDHDDFIETDTGRLRLFEAILSWLEDLSSAVPVVFIIDDLHWADTPTLELLRFILRAESRARVLFVITYRSTGPDSVPAFDEFLVAAARESAARWIELDGLTEDAIAELLHSEPSASLVESVHRMTGGNPFFVGAVLQSLDGAEGESATLTPSKDVREFVALRLGLIGPETIKTLETMAAAGAEIEAALLADIVEFDAAELDSALAEAVAAHIIVELPGLPVRHRFAHSLVRDALYERIQPARRSELHNEIGSAIERRYETRIAEHVDELVHHFSHSAERGGGIDRVIRYGANAGRSAMRQFAYDQAVRYFGAVLQAMQQPSSTIDEAERCRAMLELGVAQRRNHDLASRATLLDVSDLSAKLAQHDVLVEAALNNTRPVFWAGENTDPARTFAFERALAVLGPDQPAERAKLLADLSVERHLAGDEEAHLRTANEALAIAQTLDDVGALAHVLHFRNLTWCHPDNVEERLRLALEMRTAAEREPEASRFEYGSWAVPCYFAALELGDIDLADQSLGAMKGLSFERRDVNLAFNVRMLEASRAAIAGRHEEALRLADEMLELGRSAQQLTAPVFHLGFRFNSAFHLGRLGELIESLAAMAKAAPAVPILHFGHSLALAEEGRTEEARHVLAPFLERRFAQVPFDRDWLVSICWAARIAWLTDDSEAGVILDRLLAPYGSHFASNVTNWFGQVDGFIALLDDLGGRSGEADERLEGVALAHKRIGAPAALATTLIDRAEIVNRTDQERAAPLFDAADDIAARSGLDGVHRRVQRARKRETI